MESFYGGLPGTPFILKARFSNYNEMKTALSNPEFKDVFFGEFCIIDSPNKKDLNNGKIYRRGYHGPEYIGQIVGPNGMSVDNFRILTHGEQDLENENSFILYDSSVYLEEEYSFKKLNLYKTRYDVDEEGNLNLENTYKQYLFDYGEDNLFSEKEVPSEYKENFQYIVFDIVDYEYEKVNENNNYESIENSELKRKAYTCFLGFYDVLQNILISKDGTITSIYSSTENVVNNSKITWLEELNFDSETGILQTIMNNESQKEWYLKYVKDIKVSDDGKITLYYTTNNDEDSSKNELDLTLGWIKKINFEKDGQLIIESNNPDSEEIGNINAQLGWVKSASYNEKDNIVKFVFNNKNVLDSTSDGVINGDTLKIDLRDIKQIKIKDGNFITIYNGPKIINGYTGYLFKYIDNSNQEQEIILFQDEIENRQNIYYYYGDNINDNDENNAVILGVIEKQDDVWTTNSDIQKLKDFCQAANKEKSENAYQIEYQDILGPYNAMLNAVYINEASSEYSYHLFGCFLTNPINSFNITQEKIYTTNKDEASDNLLYIIDSLPEDILIKLGFEKQANGEWTSDLIKTSENEDTGEIEVQHIYWIDYGQISDGVEVTNHLNYLLSQFFNTKVIESLTTDEQFFLNDESSDDNTIDSNYDGNTGYLSWWKDDSASGILEIETSVEEDGTDYINIFKLNINQDLNETASFEYEYSYNDEDWYKIESNEFFRGVPQIFIKIIRLFEEEPSGNERIQILQGLNENLFTQESEEFKDNTLEVKIKLLTNVYQNFNNKIFNLQIKSSDDL